MRTLMRLSWILIAAVLAGCGSSIDDATGPGPIDPSLYKDAVSENQQRIAGEDHRVIPLYKTPLEAIGLGLNEIFVLPFVTFFDYIGNDNGAYAARKMENAQSPDDRREGMLRLVDFSYARAGIYLKGYAIYTRESEDFTVRAAAIRALNRSRAKGYTALFMRALNDDQALVRLEAADALSNIPDPDAVPLLVIHLGPAETDADVRVACADALRNFHTAEAMHALINELDDLNFGISWQARQSLELLTGQDYRYDAKAWLNYLSSTGLG
jgi:hypothetical protein